jgi:hypothetical protein
VAIKLRNQEAEALLLDIRAGRNAVRQTLSEQGGAFLVFPTSVVITTREGGQAVYPLRCATEPGALVTRSGQAQVTGVVAGVAVTGAFHWAVGDDADPPAATYRFTRHGREIAGPVWASQLPASQCLATTAPAALARQQSRLGRRSRNAEHRLLALSEQVFHSVCCGPMQRAIRYRPLLDDADVVQRGLQVACRLLPLYASSERPPCSWGAMLRLDGRRDMHREIARLDGFSADASAALTLARLAGVRRQLDPAATWADLVTAAQQRGQSVPRVAPALLDAALAASSLLAQQVDAGARAPGPEDLNLEHVERHHGAQVVAEVARLITDDTALVEAAVAGDPTALRRVGDGVVRQLSDTTESRRLAQRRCWEEFQRTGQLFTSASGRRRFSTRTDASNLAAIDESLRQALRPLSAAEIR